MFTKNENFARFHFKKPEGILQVNLKQLTAGEEQIEMFATWLGKSVAIQLAYFILKRINLGFNSENNGWHYQESEIVSLLKDEMALLLNKDWSGTNRDKVKPDIE